MEIIAIASGKGGTGKTLIASCLGYALIRAGLRVLMIDGDPATDGLSLFLLGRKGLQQISSFEPKNTFAGILSEFQRTGSLTVEPRTLHRSGTDDHGVSYNAIISGKGLYGDEDNSTGKLAVPDLDRSLFRAGLRNLFDSLRKSDEYDYVLVDTRGGFAFESTDVCALANAFIVVTEPDPTSFYQDRNLVRRISQASQEVESPSVLRAFIVNKAVDGIQQRGVLDFKKIESSFRIELTKEFPLQYEATHPVPVDIEALVAYKTQKIPYTSEPASLFSFATLSAFSDILQTVTSRWSSEQVNRWNQLIDKVSSAVAKRNGEIEQKEQEAASKERELTQLRQEVAAQKDRFALLQEEKDALRRERVRMEKSFARELERSEIANRSLMENQATPRASQKSVFVRLLTLTLILLSSVVAGLFGYRQVRSSQLNDLIVAAYNQGLPPALRVQDIYKLVTTYNYRSFDSINLDKIALKQSSFRSADFNAASLVGTDMTHANLNGANFTRADLTGANLTGANLTGANLFGANLFGTDLSGANLTGANLSGANLTGANLLKADLSGANLFEADLSGANLLKADLSGANLTGANLTGADLSGAGLAGANLSGANLTMTNVAQWQINSAILDSLTTLPKGIHPGNGITDGSKRTF